MNENLQKLTEPIGKSKVKTRTDRGTEISYVPWHTIVSRLNEVCGVDGWSFSIDSADDDGGEAVVFGTLTIGGAAKSNVGFEDNSKFWNTPGKRYKSAVSGCLKRCAALHGVALCLYGDDDAPPVGQNQQTQRRPQQSPRGNNGPQNGGNGSKSAPANNPNGPATDQQRNAVRNMANAKGTDDEKANALAAADNAQMTQKDAQEWIAFFNQKK